MCEISVCIHQAVFCDTYKYMQEMAIRGSVLVLICAQRPRQSRPVASNEVCNFECDVLQSAAVFCCVRFQLASVA